MEHHPFAPADLELPGYIPISLDQSTILAVFFCGGALCFLLLILLASETGWVELIACFNRGNGFICFVLTNSSCDETICSYCHYVQGGADSQLARLLWFAGWAYRDLLILLLKVKALELDLETSELFLGCDRYPNLHFVAQDRLSSTPSSTWRIPSHNTCTLWAIYVSWQLNWC